MIYLNTDKTKMVIDYELEESEELFIYLAYMFQIDIEVAYHLKCMQFIVDKDDRNNVGFCTDGFQFIVR